MEIYSPKRKGDTKRWDMTKTDHFGVAMPVGPCLEAIKAGDRRGHHETKEQALACFKEWALDMVRFDGQLMLPLGCEVCGDLTWRCPTVEGDHFMPLCSKHMNKDAFSAILKSMRLEIATEAADDGL